MLKLRKVAITGGLSCGKSEVCRLFKEFGAYVIDADEIVHQLLSPRTELGKQVISLLGPDIVNGNELDRARIAKKVFQNQQLLKALEDLLHPAVMEKIENQYKKIEEKQSYQIFMAEIPLLFEIGAEKGYDTTIAVIADPDLCYNRFQKSTGRDRKEYDDRMARQLPPVEKAKKADYVIVNNKGFEKLKETVKTLYHELINL
jgi:dephospho-CoA kinase